MGEEESVTTKHPKKSWVVLGILLVLGIIILAYVIVKAAQGEDPSMFKKRLLDEVHADVEQAQQDIEQASNIIDSGTQETA